MEAPKTENKLFQKGQELNYNGTMVVVVGFDAVGNPVVESRPQPISHPETLKTKDWTRAESGLGSVSVKSTPLYCR